MLVEGRIVDVRQDGEAMRPDILDGLNAQFESCVIGIVWDKGAYQRVSSVSQRELNRRHRFKVLIRPFIAVVSAKEERRRPAIPYLRSRQRAWWRRWRRYCGWSCGETWSG